MTAVDLCTFELLLITLPVLVTSTDRDQKNLIFFFLEDPASPPIPVFLIGIKLRLFDQNALILL